MANTITLTLNKTDIMQILDGLSSRVEAWEKTAEMLRDSDILDDFFIAEECSDPDEADKIAEHYRSIIRKLESQLPQ